MVSSGSSVSSATTLDDGVRGPRRDALAVVGRSLALFLSGAGVMIALFDLLGFWTLLLTAAIDPAGMLPICGLTTLALGVGATSDSQRSRNMRVGQRNLRLASVYWAASGVAPLISPVLPTTAQTMAPRPCQHSYPL